MERIIRSKFYIGHFEWGGQLYKGVHQPIIDKNLHDAAVRGLERLNKPKGRTQIIPYRGLMQCGSCGCAITGERHKKKYVYYHCTWRRGKCENKDYVEQKEIEKQFKKILENISIDEQKAQGLLIELEKTAGQYVVENESKIALLKQEYQRIQTRIERAYEDKLDDKLDEQDWMKRSRNWKEKMMSIEAEIKNLESLNPADSLTTLKRVLELAGRLKYQFEMLPEDKRAEIMKFVVLELFLKNKTLSFTYAKPFDVLAESVKNQNWGG